VPGPDRRTIGDLLADSDALARDTLLDARPEIAPAMVRSWNQLVASAAHLWAALSSPPDDMSKSDPMESLRLVGGGDRSERSRRALARARTDRRSPDRDFRQPFAGAASDRASATVALLDWRPRTDRPTPQIFTTR
jgi:hypothetical protein